MAFHLLLAKYKMLRHLYGKQPQTSIYDKFLSVTLDVAFDDHDATTLSGSSATLPLYRKDSDTSTTTHMPIETYIYPLSSPRKLGTRPAAVFLTSRSS